jgi:membrane-bound ClpP family serine protease
MVISYLFCFLAGSLLIVLAIASEADGDLDGGDGMGGPLSILLSTPFWSFGMAGLGLCGLLISLIDPQLAPILSLLVAASTGLLLGFGASRTLRVLSGRDVNSLVSSEDLIGCEGRVTLPMDSHRRGFVEVSVRGTMIRRPAVSSSEPLALNDRVIVLSDEGHTLTVIRADDLPGN